MTRILRTTRALPKETLTLQRALSIDDGGRTVYDEPGVPFEGDVVEYESATKGREFITFDDGSQKRVSLVIRVVGDSSVVPDRSDRVVRASGRRFIVGEQHPVRGLRFNVGQNDHYKLRLVDE